MALKRSILISSSNSCVKYYSPSLPPRSAACGLEPNLDRFHGSDRVEAPKVFAHCDRFLEINP